MRIVALIPKKSERKRGRIKREEEKKHVLCVMCHMSNVMYHLSCVMYHVSYARKKTFGDGDAEGLVINRVNKYFFVHRTQTKPVLI